MAGYRVNFILPIPLLRLVSKQLQVLAYQAVLVKESQPEDDCLNGLNR